MAYAPHQRLTLSGDLGVVNGAPAEHFSFGVSLVHPAPGGDNPTGLDYDNDQLNDIVADSVAFFARPETRISPSAVLKQVKLAWIGADGKYTRDPFIAAVNQAGQGATGGQTGTLHAPQVALAVSLGTGQRGASKRGRFYLPSPYINLDGTLEIPDGIRDDVQASAAQWITDLNDEPGLDVLALTVIVASTKGFNTAVSSVRVGRALDTIRTRRRSLGENYDPPTSV